MLTVPPIFLGCKWLFYCIFMYVTVSTSCKLPYLVIIIIIIIIIIFIITSGSVPSSEENEVRRKM